MYIAMFGIKKAALEEKEHGSEARKFIERNFYIDDALVSLPTEQEAITLLRNAQAMLAASNLCLHTKPISRKVDQSTKKIFPMFLLTNYQMYFVNINKFRF